MATMEVETIKERKVRIVIMVEGKEDEVVDVDGALLFLGQRSEEDRNMVACSLSALGNDSVLGTLIMNAESSIADFKQQIRILTKDVKAAGEPQG